MYIFADAIAVSRALYGRGIGDIVFDDVACTGNEENISDCRNRGLLSHNCQHSEDAGVLCKREKGRGRLQVVLIYTSITEHVIGQAEQADLVVSLLYV